MQHVCACDQAGTRTRLAEPNWAGADGVTAPSASPAASKTPPPVPPWARGQGDEGTSSVVSEAPFLELPSAMAKIV